MSRDMINSGIEWLGSVPKSWRLERLQWHLEEVKESNDPIKTTQVLSLTNKLGVIPYEEKGEHGNKSKENLSEYKLAYPETIVANSMNILIGSVGLSNYFGCVSPVYYVYKGKENSNIEFYNFLFQTREFQKELRRYANGILEIRLRVSSNNILKSYVPIPTSEEQAKIVLLLKDKISKIDELISNQEKQIEKLKDYRRATITKVVTRGIEQDIEFVKTGNKWIKEIPSHWKLIKVKFIADQISKGSGITKEEIDMNGDTPCVRYGEIYTKYNYSFEKCVTRTNKDNIPTHQFAYYGDVLFSGTGELVEEIGKNIVYLGKETILVGGDIIVLSHHENPLFLSYVLNSECSQLQKSYGKAKLKVVHISAFNISNIFIPIPPRAEQDEIACYLGKFNKDVDSIIAIKEEKIEKLQEYKKSLIYEYVTGKKEVEV